MFQPIQIKYLIILICLLFSPGLFAEDVDVIVDESSGVEFPIKVTLENNGKMHELEATGVATRSKFFVKVYSVVHYMENPKKGSRKIVLEDILTDGKTKLLKYVWLRKVDTKRILDAYRESFSVTLTDEQRERLKPEIDRLLDYLSHNSDKGEVHEYRWYPDGVLEFWINGKKVGDFKNTEFVRGLWGFWFGPQSVVKRNDLIHRIRE